MVSQNVHLFNDTIANNIAYARESEYSREQIEKAAEMAYAMDFINKMENGPDTVIGENGVMLSGGQRQRIAIARALLRDCPILIPDEATSALDTESERAIRAALDELQKDRTSLVIAHRLSTIEKADEIRWWRTAASSNAASTPNCLSDRAPMRNCTACSLVNND